VWEGKREGYIGKRVYIYEERVVWEGIYGEREREVYRKEGIYMGKGGYIGKRVYGERERGNIASKVVFILYVFIIICSNFEFKR
jgi:hypothetical protein